MNQHFLEFNIGLVGALILLMLFLFMQGLGGAGNNAGDGNRFNYDPDRENIKAIVVICGMIAICTLVWTYFSTHTITAPTPPIGLDANTLAHFLSHYKEFKNLFIFLESEEFTIFEKEQKLQTFEAFLNQCEKLTKNERKFALSMLGDILKVRYDNFSDYYLQADLIVKFSKHRTSLNVI